MSSSSLHSVISQQFWKTLGQYLAPVPSACGDKINWINYKTGIKFIKFTLQYIDGSVRIAIEFFNPDITVQIHQFEQFCGLKNEFIEICGNDWIWTKSAIALNGNLYSCISASLEEVNILKEEDWPAIISFLKPRLVTLDIFWNRNKYIFQF